MMVDAPSFIPEAKTLGAFCGHALLETPTVVAKSGICKFYFPLSFNHLLLERLINSEIYQMHHVLDFNFILKHFQVALDSSGSHKTDL